MGTACGHISLSQPLMPREGTRCRPGTAGAWISWKRGLFDGSDPCASSTCSVQMPAPPQALADAPSPAPFSRAGWSVTFSLARHQSGLSCEPLVLLCPSAGRGQAEGRVPSWLQQSPRARAVLEQPAGVGCAWLSSELSCSPWDAERAGTRCLLPVQRQRFIRLPWLGVFISKRREAAQ